MAKFCMKCGTPLQEGVRFCHKCGAAITQDAQQPPIQQPQAAPQQAHYSQTQPYTLSKGKSSGKIIAVVLIIVIIVIALIGLAVYFLVISNGDSDSSNGGSGVSGTAADLVGTWQLTEYYIESSTMGKQDLSDSTIGMSMTFNSDGSGSWNYSGYPNQFTWNIQNNQLCGVNLGGTINCSDFSFNNAKNKLTITSLYSYDYGGTSYSYTSTMVMTKT